MPAKKEAHTPCGHDCGMDAEHCPTCRKDLTAKHTPGPGPFTLGDIDADLGGGVNSETKALYRAAPDLLEAAKRALKAIDPDNDSVADDADGPLFLAAKSLRAAIAKAEGR